MQFQSLSVTKATNQMVAKIKLAWGVSIFVSLGLSFAVGVMWLVETKTYRPNEQQLVSSAAAENELVLKLKSAGRYTDGKDNFIPTGIFIQSLSFINSNDVNVVGYIWQKYTKDSIPGMDDVMDFISGDVILSSESMISPSPGFIFPEQVDSGSNIRPELAFTKDAGEHVVLGWYFETTLRQKFNYKKYPFDHKTVWIRIWPHNFSDRNYLVPWLDSYDSTGYAVAFGLDKNIVLGNWEIEETFYDYKVNEYDTGFGLVDRAEYSSYPELYFNIVLKRKFFNSVIIDVVPMLTVCTILFSVLMTLSRERDVCDKMGFNVNTVISVVSGLFFIVMLSHIHTRERFPSEGVVYIEYLYLITYFLMLAVILNSFLFALRPSWRIFTCDNLMPKLLYWPFTLTMFLLITAFCLY